MAAKAKRAAERRAEPAAVVDLNLWDVLLGLMEAKDGPEVPDETASSHADEIGGKGAAARPRLRGGKRVRDPAARRGA